MSASRNVLSFLYLSPRSLFPTGQRFPTPNHVTSAFPVTSSSGEVTSGSGDVISGSGHVTSGSGHIKTRPILLCEPLLLLLSSNLFLFLLLWFPSFRN